MANYPGHWTAVVRGLDGKTVGNTTLYTTENGAERFIITRIVFECTAATLITIAPTVSLGVTAATFSDIVAAVVITPITANAIQLPTLLTALGSIAPNTAIVVRVSVAATGTSHTFKVLLEGFYD